VLGVLTNHKQDIIDAVHKDLGRHAFEIITSEINVCKVECETILAHLADWMKPERVPSNLATLPGSSWVYRDPFGVVLIVSCVNQTHLKRYTFLNFDSVG
jgi:aldehyde dehydrogenase (NAD+)